MDKSSSESEPKGRKRWVKPTLRKIELTADETLAGGCKLGGVCDVPTPTFDGGS